METAVRTLIEFQIVSVMHSEEVSDILARWVHDSSTSPSTAPHLVLSQVIRASQHWKNISIATVVKNVMNVTRQLPKDAHYFHAFIQAKEVEVDMVLPIVTSPHAEELLEKPTVPLSVLQAIDHAVTNDPALIGIFKSIIRHLMSYTSAEQMMVVHGLRKYTETVSDAMERALSTRNSHAQRINYVKACNDTQLLLLISDLVRRMRATHHHVTSYREILAVVPMMVHIIHSVQSRREEEAPMLSLHEEVMVVAVSSSMSVDTSSLSQHEEGEILDSELVDYEMSDDEARIVVVK